MQDTSRRLEEASAIYRFKSRTTLEEFDELCGQWTDSRARNFSARILQPQRESIEDGSRLVRMHAELIAAALTAAQTADRESSSFLSARDEFESAAASTRETAQRCKDLAANANSGSNRVAGEIANINASIAAAAQDPGW